MNWLRKFTVKLGRMFGPSTDPTHGQCGAIALRFVYKRLGLRASLQDIWRAVKTPKDLLGPGAFSCSGPLMCRDALNRGLRAIQIQVKYEHGWTLLAKARQRKVEVIFTHATSDPAWHHCSVVEGLDEDTADVFDPTTGVFASMRREDLLESWGRLGNEGGGHCLLSVSNAPHSPAACEGCGTPIPLDVRCPESACRRSVPIDPGFMLGCVNKECPEATWESIACPYCTTPFDELRSWSPW